MAGLSELTIVPLVAWTSGISIYLTVAILGISSKAGWIQLPGSMDILSNPLIIVLAILIYAVEFVADKVPFVDSAWDSIHTFVRPTASAYIGYLAGTDYGPLAQTAMALFTGTITLDSHAIKSGVRLAVNTSPEPFSNIATSVAEHSYVVFLFWYFVKHPWITLAIVVGLICLSVLILRWMWRFIRKVFSKPSKPADIKVRAEYV